MWFWHKHENAGAGTGVSTGKNSGLDEGIVAHLTPRTAPTRRLGLHINLSEGVPISNPESIPSLVEGRVFVGKTQLLAAANAHKARERRGGGKEIKGG